MLYLFFSPQVAAELDAQAATEFYAGGAAADTPLPPVLPAPYCAEYSAVAAQCDCPPDPLGEAATEHSCVDWFHHVNLRAPAEAVQRSALVPGLAEIMEAPRIVTG